jgi:DNA helicase HerA-like ATPase
MDMHARIDAYRSVRRELEESVLPLVTSIDGAEFTFQSSLHGLALHIGGYVVIESDAAPRLGQVLALEPATVDGAELELAADDAGRGGRTVVAIRLARGSGAVLEGDGAPFHDATVRPAEPAEVAAWLERRAPRRARLAVGELALAPGVPLALDAGGFDRHTFMCGQSGSGKTYSLGVMLEQLLLETRLRVVVLDPNSDYVRMGEARGGVEEPLATRYREAAAGLDVHRAGAAGADRLRLRFAELDPAAQAALLQLDPIADREEHAELDALLAAERPPTLEAFLASERPEGKRLAMRVRNLGIDEFGVWALADAGSTLEAIGDAARRGVVVDLGSLRTRAEQALMAAGVLGELWRRREERRPVLVVIDEAHNVCPAEPEDRLTALATDYAVRIAAEGRKFGLYLLVSTQRPQKVHPNVVTQCDNLVLMRLNSAADGEYAREVFSFVPPGLLARAPAFGLGEALVAGKICPSAALLRFGRRVAEEGGADVPADWANL